MGLSASQARFLQLTARKSNVEYQVQQISHERLQLSQQLQVASETYNDKISNRKLVYRYNDGSKVTGVDITYQNYKDYLNLQLDGVFTTDAQYFLVSSSGNKIVCSSEEDMDKMIEENKDKMSLSPENFTIVNGLDDTDNFQKAIQEGIYYFAKNVAPQNAAPQFETVSWETLGGGAISEEFDKTDDAAAEAEYEAIEARYQNYDKKLELELNQLETERSAIQTEMDSVQKVMDDNIEKTFQIFS